MFLRKKNQRMYVIVYHTQSRGTDVLKFGVRAGSPRNARRAFRENTTEKTKILNVY